MNGRTILEGIEQCVEIAERRKPDDVALHLNKPELIRALQIETFIAALSGVLQRDDMALSNRVFALLSNPKHEASK